MPTGTTSIDLHAVGGGGGGSYVGSTTYATGGDGGHVSGTATLPNGTAYVKVIVGSGGTGGTTNPTVGGGGASAMFALDSSHALLSKLAIAGGGGGSSYYGNGGDAGADGTTNDSYHEGEVVASTIGAPGQGASASTGGAGGYGRLHHGSDGANDDPTTATVAAGGDGGDFYGSGGGQGGSGYGGGGGGGTGQDQGSGATAYGGGGGGSSYLSSAVSSPSIGIATGTGGPYNADGVTGSVTLTFNGVTDPGAPTGVTATPGNTQATVSFTAPASDGGSTITGYTATSSPGSITATCTSSPCVVHGLTNGVAYTFTVHATNIHGDSAESSASSAVTPALVPGAPTGASATASNGQASVSFTAPASDGGSTITGYTATSSPGGHTGTCVSSPCTVTGLTNGTAYTFTVHATNAIGDSAESTATAAVTPLSAPGTPTAVSASPGNGQATISFTAPTNTGGTAITGYTATSTPGGFTGTCVSSPCVVHGLTNGTSYTFTVHATNSVGDSSESTATSAVVPAMVPGAPTGASATASAGQAQVSFTAPSSTGGSAITGYTVTSSPGGHIGTCVSSPCTVTGLTNGTAYTFTVHATNAIGNSAESSATSAVTPLSVPGAPTAVTATPGDSQASVAFTAPSDNGGTPITGYTATSSPGGHTATCTTSPCTVTGLTNGTTYTFTVIATNTVGDSAASAASSSVTAAAVPGAPTGVSAVRGDGSAEVSFTPPVNDGGSAITGYTATSSPGGLTATCVSSPCSVTGLTNGTAYTFTVRATNTTGNSVASAASAAITPATVPDAPRALTATSHNGSIGLSFTAPESTGGAAVTSYEVSLDGGATWGPLTTSGTATLTATISNLTNGTNYSIKVRAVNAVGAGTASEPVIATPTTTPGAPTGVTAVGGAGRATVSFTAPTATGGAAVTSYTVTATPGSRTATCTASPCTITGLTNGVSYTFTVHARNTAGDSAESSSSNAVTPKTTPGAPSDVTTTAAATTVAVTFSSPNNGGSPITSYQVSTDGGTTWLPITVAGTAPELHASIDGLAAGTTYHLVLRARNAVGTGAASTSAEVTTLPATLATPTAVAGISSATISWTKSSTATVTGYTVYAHPGPATCTTTSIDDTSCLIGATAGTTYTYTVVAHSPAGDSTSSADSSEVVAADPAIPATAPLSAPTTLTTTDGVLTKVDPGQRVKVIGTGFAAYSTATIIIYSTPIVLGSVTADAHGNFTKLVTVPTTLAAGSHNLVASGVDPAGAVHEIRMPVKIFATATSSNGSSDGTLAGTGTPILQLIIWAAFAASLGALFLVVGGRRREQDDSA